LLDYVCGGPCLAMVWRGPAAVSRVRETVGLRPQPIDCEPGSIRHDLGCDTVAASREEGRALENLVHTSDGRDAAAREITLWGLVVEKQHK
jgi:nucleoside-diphosphate kinase